MPVHCYNAPLTLNQDFEKEHVMHWETDDLRIDQLNPLIPPAILMEEYPVTDHSSETVAQARRSIAECVRGRNDRITNAA